MGGSSSGQRWARWDGEQCTCAFSGSPEGGTPMSVNIFCVIIPVFMLKIVQPKSIMIERL